MHNRSSDLDLSGIEILGEGNSNVEVYLRRIRRIDDRMITLQGKPQKFSISITSSEADANE